MTQPPDSQKNFLVVDQKTENSAIEAAFDRYTSERKDIAILLINQHVRLPRSNPSLDFKDHGGRRSGSSTTNGA